MKQLLSPRKVAAAIGVSESTLKRWADEGLIKATRTAGGHRRIPVTEAIRFVRETQARIVDPTILGLTDVEGLAEAPLVGAAERSERFYSALVEGRGTRVRGVLTQLFLDGVPVAEICDEVMCPAIRRIGEIWREQEEGIFIEHRATDLCIQALNMLQTLIAVDDEAPVAVGGAPPGDPYLVASLMAAICLRESGVRALNLGPDTPVDSLLHAADHASARLVWLSVSSTPGANLPADVSRLSTELERRDACLVVGGREAVDCSIEPRPNLYRGANMRELVAFARGVLVTGRRDEHLIDGPLIGEPSPAAPAADPAP